MRKCLHFCFYFALLVSHFTLTLPHLVVLAISSLLVLRVVVLASVQCAVCVRPLYDTESVRPKCAGLWNHKQHKLVSHTSFSNGRYQHKRIAMIVGKKWHRKTLAIPARANNSLSAVILIPCFISQNVFHYDGFIEIYAFWNMEERSDWVECHERD